MGRRLEWTWRGTAARHTALLKSVSPGPVRPTNGPWGALKTRPTATPIDWPPDRRATDMNASPVRNALLQHLFDADLSPMPPRQPGTWNQTASLPQSQTDSRPATTDANRRDALQTPTDANATEITNASTGSPGYDCSVPHECLEANRRLNRPPSVLLSQSTAAATSAAAAPSGPDLMSCQRAFFDALADRMTRAHWEAEWDAQVGNGVFFHSRWLPSLDKRKQITIETDPSPKATTNTTEKATPPIAVIMRQQRAHNSGVADGSLADCICKR